MRNTQTQSKEVTSQIGTIPDLVCGSGESMEAGLCYKTQQAKEAEDAVKKVQDAVNGLIPWRW